MVLASELILQLELEEAGDLCVHAVVQRVIDVLESGAWNQARDAAGDDGIVAEQRTIFETAAQVDADVIAHLAGEQELFEDIGVVEPEEVAVVDHAEPGRQLEIDSGVRQEKPGINKIGLALNLARAQV